MQKIKTIKPVRNLLICIDAEVFSIAILIWLFIDFSKTRFNFETKLDIVFSILVITVTLLYFILGPLNRISLINFLYFSNQKLEKNNKNIKISKALIWLPIISNCLFIAFYIIAIKKMKEKNIEYKEFTFWKKYNLLLENL
ncbi:hypothetical protein [Spiroplasma floricola]|uniref:Uncharacterized protein n=1 Tax=Spiroplasma floricola 23-6 TaxID=1336749 RepID=A0A2K8SG66_9MOLU|nr:hypothetical protein [Spiroplasma floricola]AUB31810.1 hypothetical protein SFLOR_v1c07620 [Spiroplasma floricola 23-6]